MIISKLSDEHKELLAKYVCASPEYFKVCEGCEEINSDLAVMCVHCNGYRFDANKSRTLERLRLLMIEEGFITSLSAV